MSKILDKINDMLIQKFPEATHVKLSKTHSGMYTTVHYQTGITSHSINSLNGEEQAVNIIKEED